MPCGVSLDIELCRGEIYPVRWALAQQVYKPIVDVTQAAPAVAQVPGHGLPAGWPFTIAGARGMVELNSQPDPYSAVVVDADTLQLNELNALDLSPYTGGGVVQYAAPADLAGYTAALRAFTDAEYSTLAFTLSSGSGGILLDNTAKTITVVTTTGLPVGLFYHRLELTPPSGPVVTLGTGQFRLV